MCLPRSREGVLIFTVYAFVLLTFYYHACHLFKTKAKLFPVSSLTWSEMFVSKVYFRNPAPSPSQPHQHPPAPTPPHHLAGEVQPPP